MSSTPPTGASTPNSRFTSQGHTAEDLLKEQTVGLVHLSDFRKRRAEATERAGQDASATPSGASTPTGGRDSEIKAAFKKRKKGIQKPVLSFDDGEEEEENGATTPALSSRAETPADSDGGQDAAIPKMKLKASNSVAFKAKAMTKSALAREAALKDSLRKEFLQIQEAVKATDFAIPFVFFDGSHVPGGVCRMKKGDHVWLFLEKARKMGAAQRGEKGERKDWARIGVDDLMLVRGDLILPHHYEFYTFIVDKSIGYQGILFPHSSEATAATPKHLLPSSAGSTPARESSAPPESEGKTTAHLMTAAQIRQQKDQPPAVPDPELEGFDEAPTLTKVVDRRWYERNKHIYPASVWEDFDANRDYSKGSRKDAMGNAFFFSR